MAERKFFRARNIIIIIISIILLAASVAGITIFLKDKGEAEAAEQDLIDKLPVAGDNEENNETGENNSETGEDVVTPVNPGTSGNSGSSGITGGNSQSGTLTEEILAGITETVVEQERKVYEDLKLSWTTISIPTIKASMGIYKPELQIEKTATGLVKADNPEETIEINSENVPMVRPGDLIIYTIKVSNIGNYKATNIIIKETLDVMFDGKEIKAGEPLVILETLDYGKVAILKVAYVVTEEDIAEEKNIKNTAYVVDGNIEEQDDDYIIPVNPDIEDIIGTKTWDDEDNQDGIRPESITVNLLADGEKIQSKQVKESDNWKWTFSNLPKYAEDGTVIEYTISEEAVEDYTTSINGYDITNTHIPETVEVTGSKTWEDNNDQDGIRPDSITINLLADGEKVKSKPVTEADEWKWEFTGLPKYEAGREIVYTIEEEAVTGYTTEVSGYNVTNTHTPETISVSGNKTWEDNNDQDGIRPDSITINLLADGQKVDSETVTKLDRWEWNFTGLPKYEAGREIVYTIAEDTVTGYSTQVNGYNVTNTHIPETITVSGSKTWEDNDDQDGIRPDSITITLYANNEFKARETVTEADNWSWTFAGLPKYEDGEIITYTITEDPVSGYSTEVSGYNVTNTYTPETITISGSKTWEDNDDQDGMRPDSITINLLADGTEVESKTVTASDNWSWSFTGKAKYSAGTEIVYTIEEEAVTGYSPDVNGYNVTNTHTPETITVSGSKTWNDNNNQAGIRPTSITINLLANGTKVDSKVVTASDNWSWSFTGKAKYSAGREIVYTIEEETVGGYTTNVNGYNVTNTLETIKVSVHKGWQVPYITAHPAVTVQLYQNDDAYDTPVTLNAEKAWAHEWTVPKYSFKAGVLIENEYTIREMSIVGTEQDLSQYNVTYSNKDNNINEKAITNTAKGIVETISYTQGVDRYERPVDVVLVLDTSGSMAYANTNNTTRAEDMVTAVNETIATIMEHNAASRVAVVSYSDNAETLLELGRYEDIDENDKYLKYNENNRNITINTNVKELTTQKTVEVEGATYIQSGIAEGANILTSENNDPIYEENGTEGYHIPILILLSDGAPTRYTTNYDEVGVATGGDGSTATNNTAYYTIKTAVAYKAKIAQKYNNEAHMYTIGYGVDSLLLRTVLEPSASNIEECKESDWFSYTRALYNNLANEGNVNYADGSYAGKMDSDELSTLLNHFIHSSITSTTHRIFSKAEIDAGKVYLENINKNKSFSLHYGDTSYVTLQEAEQAQVVKEDNQGVYVDLSVIGTTKQIHVSYHEQ